MDGRVSEGLKLLQHASMLKSTLFDKQHPEWLCSQAILGDAYLAKGHTKQAIKTLRSVVQARETTLNEDHQEHLMVQKMLALAFPQSEDIKQATELLEALVHRMTALDRDHSGLLESQRELARAYLADGRVKEVVGLLEYFICTNPAPVNHPSQLTAQFVLARTYWADGRSMEAISLLESVINAQKQFIGKNHPDLAVTEECLAEYLKSSRLTISLQNIFVFFGRRNARPPKMSVAWREPSRIPPLLSRSTDAGCEQPGSHGAMS